MEIDVRGEMCPYPAMKAKEGLEKLAPGEKLVMITDHAPALSTVPWVGATMGFSFSIAESGPGEWQITLERAEGGIDRNQALQDIARAVAELGVE